MVWMKQTALLFLDRNVAGEFCWVRVPNACCLMFWRFTPKMVWNLKKKYCIYIYICQAAKLLFNATIFV